MQGLRLIILKKQTRSEKIFYKEVQPAHWKRLEIASLEEKAFKTLGDFYCFSSGVLNFPLTIINGWTYLFEDNNAEMVSMCK